MTETDLTVKKSQATPGTPSSVGRERRERPAQPPVDVFESADGITLWVDLPGVPKDKLDVQVHDSNLYIEAEASIVAAEKLTLHHAEVPYARYSRAFAVSGDFDTEKIDANLKDGVLKVTIPRHERARPRKINVQIS
jgi:HSP20 family molecular chaperone IbpA